ncbi:hypothetical protein Dsin_010886 [Dipteronia sinensis]|uniref:Uncharacterized protein n=1 Tax=Dipteronia sinensis TaxID=43782 RepID=A0AAE0ATA5_9ROSI|nr:hypothetical protein Dsin_010886 [Dipteronia sinensis]
MVVMEMILQFEVDFAESFYKNYHDKLNSQNDQKSITKLALKFWLLYIYWENVQNVWFVTLCCFIRKKCLLLWKIKQNKTKQKQKCVCLLKTVDIYLSSCQSIVLILL